MGTAAQIHANRENSQKSTGPASGTGRRTSSQNAAKHGLSSHRIFYLMTDEDPARFKELVESLNQEHQPQTQTESDLVSRMAQHEWLRARALRLQDHCLEPGQHVSTTEHFSLYLRYQTSNERAYSKCLKDLLTLRAERRNVQIGFVSQNRAAAAEQRAEKTLALKQNVFELQNKSFEFRKAHLLASQKPSETPKSPALPPQQAA